MLSGMTNALSLTELGYAVGYTSGATMNVGRSIASGASNVALLGGTCIAYTGAGVIAGLFGSKCDDLFEGRISPGLLISAACLAAGTAVRRKLGKEKAWLALLLWAFSQGLQNAVTSGFSSAAIRTTHTAGGMTDVGISLGQWVRACCSGKVPASLRKSILTTVTILSFAVGGFAGGLTQPRYGIQAGIIPAGALAAAATVLPAAIAPAATAEDATEDEKKKI